MSGHAAATCGGHLAATCGGHIRRPRGGHAAATRRPRGGRTTGRETVTPPVPLRRPRGRLAAAPKAVLRVRASKPCAPPGSQWPTVGGVWAFEVIVPVSIAIEVQTWMEDRRLKFMWLPDSPPGLCRQCAFGERVCVQTRNCMEVGAPPRPQAQPRQKKAAEVRPKERPLLLDYTSFS